MANFLKDKKGFTLLEIMVAMAIMAIALVTVIQLFSGALRSARVSHDYSLAVMGAKEKLDEALTVSTLNEFDELEKTGEFESEELKGYRWEITGPDEYQMPEGLAMDVEEESGVLSDLPFKLYQIGITVRWASGLHEKEISYNTLKILEEED